MEPACRPAPWQDWKLPARSSPASIEGSIPPERLARYFTRAAEGWRVVPGMRNAVVFTVRDVLTDPPFSRLDPVPCRNLLICLDAEPTDGR